MANLITQVTPYSSNTDYGLRASAIQYGTCSTGADTAVKAVTCATFLSNYLTEGAIVAVKFSNANTAAVGDLKLNVNSTGQKAIKYIYNGSLSNIPAPGYLKANQIYLFYYDGTNWVVLLNYNTNTTYSFNNLGATLAWNTAVDIAEVGGTTITAKLPADPDYVTQKTISTNSDYPILLKKSANTTDEKNTVNATGTTVAINPSTGNLKVTKINGVTVGDNPKFTDTTYTFSCADATLGWGATTTIGNMGGTELCVTMPDNPNTDKNVLQTAVSTDANYRVLFSGTASNDNYTGAVCKDGDLTYNPSTNNLSVTKINGVAVGNNPKFTDTTYSFSTGTEQLAWDQSVTLANTGGIEIKAKLPKQPKLITGTSASASSNAAASSNGNVYLNLVEGTSVINSHNIAGANGTTVTSDANGKITITGKTIDSNDVTNALGYIPQEQLGYTPEPQLGFTPVNKAGDTMTGLLTLSGAPTSNLHAATKKYVDDVAAGAVAAAGGLVFKGVLGTGTGMIGSLPNNVKREIGWTYKVGTAGTYANQTCEVGDVIVFIKDVASGTNTAASDIVVVQNNLDKASTSAYGYTKLSSTSSTTEESLAATPKGVWAAIANLDGNLNNTTPSAGKTLTAFSQTDGVVSATFGNISITKSQVSDFSHTHGDIQNNGTITATNDISIGEGDKIVITDSSGSNKIVRSNITFDGVTATDVLTKAGTWASIANFALDSHNHDDRYLKLAGGTLTGDTYHNSSTGSKKFYFTRNGTATESTAVWVDDSYTYFDVTNDETTANVKFTLHATDTESNGGAGEQTSYVTFTGTSGKSTVTADYFTGLASSATKATGDSDGNAINTTYIKKSVLSGAYDIMYSSSANNPTRLAANTSTTKKFLSMTGTGSAGAAPTWSTVTAADVGVSATTTSVTVNGTTFNKYTHPIGEGYNHIPSGGSSGQFLGWDSSGMAKWVNNPNTNTDTLVTQTATTTDANYEVLFSATADNTTRTETARKNSNLKFNPSSGRLDTTEYAINSKAYIHYNTTDDVIAFTFI